MEDYCEEAWCMSEKVIGTEGGEEGEMSRQGWEKGGGGGGGTRDVDVAHTAHRVPRRALEKFATVECNRR